MGSVRLILRGVRCQEYLIAVGVIAYGVYQYRPETSLERHLQWVMVIYLTNTAISTTDRLFPEAEEHNHDKKRFF